MIDLEHWLRHELEWLDHELKREPEATMANHCARVIHNFDKSQFNYYEENNGCTFFAYMESEEIWWDVVLDPDGTVGFYYQCERCDPTPVHRLIAGHYGLKLPSLEVKP